MFLPTIDSFNKKKQASPFLLIATAGLLFFFVFVSIVSFKNNKFNLIFFKQRSFAEELSHAPTVDLKINYKGKILDSVADIAITDLPMTLTWTTTGNPTSCMGTAWGIGDRDKDWDGSKNPRGDTFAVTNINGFNPYVYTINCANEKGDSAGDSVTINLGASKNDLLPYITQLKIYNEGGQEQDRARVVIVKKGTKIKIRWSSLNTTTPYSVCIASGSWPIVYKNPANATVTEELLVKEDKVYRFTIYCSNETDNAKVSVNIFTE